MENTNSVDENQTSHIPSEGSLKTSELKAARRRGAAEMAWKIAQALCEWCGDTNYNLIFHHDEWRHYRQSDMHVEYCKAELVFRLCRQAARGPNTPRLAPPKTQRTSEQKG